MGEVLVVRVLEHKGLKGYIKSAVLRKHSDHGSRLTIHDWRFTNLYACVNASFNIGFFILARLISVQPCFPHLFGTG